VTRPVRVLSIATLFPNPSRPGFGRFVERQANAVAARDDVELVVVNPLAVVPGPLAPLFHNSAELATPQREQRTGYAVHRPRYPRLPLVGPRLNPALIARAVLPLVRRLHCEAPFDLVDAQFFFPDGPAAARIAAALGLPLTIKARGSDIHHWGTVSHARRAMLDAAGKASALLSVSAALAGDMATLGMDRGKIEVHYTGLDHTLFHPRDRAEARHSLASWDEERDEITTVPAGGRLLVSVGNLIPLKGQALVIEALASLPDTHLLICGSGPESRNLRDQAEAIGVANRVHIGGYAPQDLAVVLAAADAMVLPSANEGLANAWIEALACGTPLVITDVGGAREVVTSPAAGRIVKRTPQAIAEGVRALLADPPSQAETASHAARFSWDANAARLAETWRRAAGLQG
jgi:glycosyltransferase involved in cell wall biosynthesis